MFCPDCGTWNRTKAVKCLRCQSELPDIEGAPKERPDEELSTLRRLIGSRYRVVRRLGSGGMANVYFAEHQLLERSLVLKVLHAHLAKDPEMRERFRREAEAASQLQHPHICPIIDYFESGEAVFIVMPYLEGGSLADILTRDRTVAIPRAVAISAQVSAALDYAHRRGIVHRDVKPDNVLFDEMGHALLTDFGIATARFHGRLTGTGRAMGTPHYMSPEQAMGKMVDGRSDIYAVGVMLYEQILGFPPFDGADSYSVGYKHVHEQPVAPEVVDSKVPAEVSQIVMKCLAKAPADRFASGDELTGALLDYLLSSGHDAEARMAWFARRGAGVAITPFP